MTHFSLLAFTEIWLSVCTFLSPNWNRGRGRKTNIQAKAALFMMIIVLKHGHQWEFTASVFEMKPPTFERLI